jgi:hypothetical protein
MQRSERQIFIRSGSITITSGIRSGHNQSDYDIEKCTKVCVHNYAATCATGFAQAMAAEEEASAAAAAAAAKKGEPTNLHAIKNKCRSSTLYVLIRVIVYRVLFWTIT